MIGCFLISVVLQAPEPVRFGGFQGQIDGLEEPAAVAVGPSDEIFVVERFAHRVRVFDAAGKELRRFGGLEHEAGRLLEPQGIAVASDGTVYVANPGRRDVAIFDREGRLPIHATSSSSSGRRTPLGLAVSSERVYIASGRQGVLWFASRTPRRIGESSGDGELDRPVDVALDADGHAYVADAARHRIVKLDRAGHPLKIWGDFGPYSGQFASPTGIEHAADRIYVADRDNHRIQVFDTDGKLIYDWGVHALRPHEGNGRLHYPNDIAIAPSGRFAAVCEGFENRVQIFGPETGESLSLARNQERNTAAHFGFGVSTAGRVAALVEPSAPSVLVYDVTQEEPIEITRFGSYGQKVGGFRAPLDLELDSRGEICFVADADAHRIDAWRIARGPDEPLRYDPLLAQLVHSFDFSVGSDSKAARSNFVEPIALASDRSEHLWVVDAAGPAVFRFDLDVRDGQVLGIAAQGSHPLSIGGTSVTADEPRALLIPTDVAVSRDGRRVFVVDAGEQRVEAYSIDAIADGKSIDAAFSFGGYGTGSGQFVRPTGICAGVDGFVYVTDEGGHRVCKFDEQGKFIAAWGEQGLGRVQFYKPRGISQAADGKLYVVDYGNHRGQVLTSSGEFVVAFGARAFIQPTRTAK